MQEIHIVFISQIVCAFVSRNVVPPSDVVQLIGALSVQFDLLGGAEAEVDVQPRKPAVSVKKSISNHKLTCLECGRNFKSIKRHLMSKHGLSPDQYRQAWNLARDYPMVAAAYAQTRSNLALKQGLGRQGESVPAGRGRAQRKSGAGSQRTARVGGG